MTDYRTFKSGEILSDDERAKLSPEDRKRYDLEQKLRGLMKLANDERASDGERDNATRMISKLITRHQIDLALIREAKDGATGPVEIVRFEVLVSNKLGLGGVRCQALHRAVISPLGGHSVFFHSSAQSASTEARLEIYLAKDVVDFAKMLLASLTLQVETSMKVAAVRHKRELDWDWRLTKSDVTKLVSRFRKGYLLAWGSTVGSRVAEGRAEAREEAQRFTGKELAVLDTKELAKKASEDWNRANGFRITKSRPVLVSETGRTAGRRDGLRARLGTNEVGGRRTALNA